jgi:glyoxylase I family protein
MSINVEGLAPLIQVFDMPTSVAFYRDNLGFELVMQSQPGPDFDWCLLRLNGTELMLNTAYERQHRPSVPDTTRVGAHEDTALYFACRDVDAAYTHLRAKGVDLGHLLSMASGLTQVLKLRASSAQVDSAHP